MIVAAKAVRRLPVTGLPMAEMSTHVPAAASAPAAPMMEAVAGPMMMKIVVAEMMKAVPEKVVAAEEAVTEAGPETMTAETAAKSLRDGVDVSHCQRE
jgi:hypothetical protein